MSYILNEEITGVFKLSEDDPCYGEEDEEFRDLTEKEYKWLRKLAKKLGIKVPENAQ